LDAVDVGEGEPGVVDEDVDRPEAGTGRRRRAVPVFAGVDDLVLRPGALSPAPALSCHSSIPGMPHDEVAAWIAAGNEKG
jgi:hypothetical protein